jgi:L-amino acid N-acyltransferase YncA
MSSALFSKKISNGYEIREMLDDDFWPLIEKHHLQVFQETIQFNWRNFAPEEDLKKNSELTKNMGQPYRLKLGVFLKDEFAGWSFGDQQSGESYYMRNSAVLETHRKKGLYSELLKANIEIFTAKGFQVIYSAHIATNNAILIPKLKAGFVITSLEIEERFGTRVRLSYFTSQLRKKIVDFRVGFSRPDEELKDILKL